MTEWRAGEVARMAGVTVRTLHHYDRIGLLAPSSRSEAGYRLYTREDLLRLQQILLYRAMGLPLAQIREVLDAPGFDVRAALAVHLELTRAEIARLGHVVSTIEKTLKAIDGEDDMLKDEELYRGLAPAEVARWRREARERYGDAVVTASEAKVRALSKGEWDAVAQEGETVSREFAELMDRPVEDPAVQALVARHFAWIQHFWQPNSVSYRALGEGYVSDPEFRAHYDAFRPGLAEYLARAMARYADDVLAPREDAE